MTLVPNYVPIDWVDNVTTVDEAKMDHIETTVDAHADAINALDTRLAAEEAMADIPTVVNGKWIKGVSGAMVWSDITIADVANLQTSLNAKQDTSAKGAANGYASLDSGGKVPTAQLPVSIDLRYAGAYSAATAYNEGDVVIYNGVSYMALRPSTGETPAPWGTGAGGALTYFSDVRVADVTGISASTWSDVATVPLTTGTWLVAGQFAFVQGSGGNGNMAARISDNTTTWGTVEAVGVVNASQFYGGSIMAKVTLAADATVRLQGISSRGSWQIKAAGVTYSMAGASQMTAVKLA